MLSVTGKFVVVGAGKMGMALARGWIKEGLSGNSLVLVDPQPHDSVIQFAEECGAKLTSEFPDTAPQVVLLAVKPQVFADVMDDFAAKIGPETLVLSIMAGIGLSDMMAGLKTGRIVRTMPNTPAQVGKGVTGLVRGQNVNDADWQLSKDLFAAVGLVVELSGESQIDALTALSGSGPAYVFHMVEAMAAAGEDLGLDAMTAAALARQTVIGAASLMDNDENDAATLRQNVTSKAGVTAEALAVLMAEDGLVDLMRRALRAARDRSVELGKL